MEGEIPVRTGYPAQEPSSSTQSGSSCQCPGPAKEADSSWWYPQRQVPRPCPAVIAEGTRHPGLSQPSDSSGYPNGRQVPRTATHGYCRHSRSRRKGKGEGLLLLKARAWTVGSHGEGSGALQDTALSLSHLHPSSFTSPRSEGLEGPGEKIIFSHLSLPRE